MQVHFHASYVTDNYICPGTINLYPFACFLAIADNNTKLVDKGYLFNLTVHLEMLLSPHLLAVISFLIVFRYFMEEQYLGAWLGYKAATECPGRKCYLVCYHQCCPHPTPTPLSGCGEQKPFKWTGITLQEILFNLGLYGQSHHPNPCPLYPLGPSCTTQRGSWPCPAPPSSFLQGKLVPLYEVCHWPSSNGASEIKGRCLSFKQKYAHQL